MIDEIIHFVNWLRRRNPQARTWRDYSYDLKQFVALVGDKPPATVSIQDIDNFVTAQAARGLKPATINRHLAAIMSLYTFLCDEDPDLVCPVLPHRHDLRESQRLPRPIPATDLQRFFAAIQDRRDQAMFLLMLRCGLRIVEVGNLRLRDLYLAETPPRLLVRGKNSKERIVYLSDQVWQAVQSYLYQGLRLDEAERWAESPQATLNRDEQAFLQASLKGRQTRKLWRVAAVAAVILVILLFAFTQTNAARTQSNIASTAQAESTRAFIAEGNAQVQTTRTIAEANRANAESTKVVQQAAITEAEKVRADAAANIANARLLVAQGQSIHAEDPMLGLALVLEGISLINSGDADLTLPESVLQEGRIQSFGSNVEHIIQSPDDLIMVIDHINAPGEVRYTANGALLTELAGGVDWVTFSPDEAASIFVVDYADAAGEIRQTADGALLTELAGEVDWVTFSSDETPAFILASYFSGESELFDFDSLSLTQLAKLNVNMADASSHGAEYEEYAMFSPDNNDLTLLDNGGQAYFYDLAWLRAMGGRGVDEMEINELVEIACAGPMSRGWLDEDKLLEYLNVIGIDEPQACQ